MLAGFFGCFFSAAAYAQTYLEGIDVPIVQAGQEADMIVTGSGLLKVRRVDAVRFDSEIIQVIHYEIESDRRMRVRFRVPDNASSGEHRISVQVSDEERQIWLAPKGKISADRPQSKDSEPAIQLYYHGESVNHMQELSVEFTPDSAGTPVSGPFTLKNTGTANWKTGNIGLPPGVRFLNPVPPEITPGESIDFSLASKLPQRESPTGEMQLLADSQRTLRIKMGGAVLPPLYKIEVWDSTSSIQDNQHAPVVFDSTSRGNSVHNTLILKNNGTKSIRLNIVELPASFSVVDFSPAVIPAGDSLKMKIRFLSESPGTFGGPLRLVLNDGIRHLFSFPISGTVSPTSYSGVQFLDGEKVIVAGQTKALDFPETFVGKPVDKVLYVRNSSADTMWLKNAHLPPGFRTGNSLPLAIAPGGTSQLTLGMVADSAGEFSGMINIQIENGEERIFAFPVSAIVSPAPPPRISLYEIGQPQSLLLNSEFVFDSTTTEDPVIKEFKIGNAGPWPLALTNLHIPSGFRLIDNFPTILQPRDSAGFRIQLAAESAGTYSGTLEFDAASGSISRTFRFNLSGIVSDDQAAPKPAFPWIFIFLAAMGILLVAGTSFLFRRKTGFGRTSRRARAGASSQIRFEIQKGHATQQIPAEKEMHTGVEIRIVPVVDAGIQRIAAPQGLLEESQMTISSVEKTLRKTKTAESASADDLTQIEGIGPKIARLLAKNEIRRFDQVAVADFQMLRNILDDAHLWMTSPETWAEQARLAAEGNWNELRKLKKKLKWGRRVAAKKVSSIHHRVNQNVG